MAERLPIKMVCAFAWAIALRSGKRDCNGPSKDWWTNFKAHHPFEKLTLVELKHCPDVVNKYFEETLAKKMISQILLISYITVTKLFCHAKKRLLR